MSNRDFFASIDIGSSKIVLLIAEIENNKIHVFAHATGESFGVSNGVITNLELATKSIQAVINKIKKTCKERVININTNINDLHLSSSNQNRQISFNGKTKTITEEDILDAIQNASAGTVAVNNKKLDPVINNFTVDEQIVEYPIGLEGHVLGVDVHLLSVSNQAFTSVINCLNGCELGVDKIVLDSIASSKVCISQEQKDEGVCLLDIGSSISNISVFSKGVTSYSRAFKFGGNTITEHIAQAYNTSFAEAERLKLKYGVLEPKSTLKDCLIEFQQMGSNEQHYLSLYELITVVENSYKALCSLIKKNLKAKKLDRVLKAGIVIMGGASKIENCEHFFLKEFRIRTKIAKINRGLVSGNEELLANISYLSAFGLLTYNTSEAYLQATEQVQKNGIINTIHKLLEL
jgi:cell division protein FtsA